MEKAGGGSIMTLTYLGGERVVAGYKLMGPAKATLDANVRYLAENLGPHNIRVNAISAGAMRTLSLAGIPGGRNFFLDLPERTPTASEHHASRGGRYRPLLGFPSFVRRDRRDHPRGRGIPYYWPLVGANAGTSKPISTANSSRQRKPFMLQPFVTLRAGKLGTNGFPLHAENSAFGLPQIPSKGLKNPARCLLALCFLPTVDS